MQRAKLIFIAKLPSLRKNLYASYVYRRSIGSGTIGIMKEQNWAKAGQEIEQLCKLHDEAVANSELCREFANQMSLFLSELEDLNCQSMANMAMDILLLCNPKVASHCDKASMEKGRLEQMKAEIGKKLEESQQVFPIRKSSQK
jgi:hypothetical protein